MSFSPNPMTMPFEGRNLTAKEIAAICGTNINSVYRYYKKNGTAEGFEGRNQFSPSRIPLDGELVTMREAAQRLGSTVDAVRHHFNRHKTLNGFGTRSPAKGKPIKHLERYYNTLDESIPLDRCLKFAGYRSVRQFCETNEVSQTLVGCWRRGKICNERDILWRHPSATVVDEMTNFKKGFSTPLIELMEGTGFLEYELFPEVFTDRFYGAVLRDSALQSCHSALPFHDMERREARRVIKRILRTIPTRHGEIVEWAFGLSKNCYGSTPTLEEIGRRFGLTRERVRQIVVKGMRELRSPQRLRLLKEVCWWRNFQEDSKP